MVREYITQAIKPRKRMKRVKREEVGKKMNEEATVIYNSFRDLVCITSYCIIKAFLAALQKM